MKEKISINIHIGGRYYPMKIKVEEEVMIRKAAKIINEKIARYKKANFQNIDNYDCIAMTSLHFATKMLKIEKEVDILPFFEEINEINKNIDKFLRKNE